jgi:hypothetical protein
VSPNDPTWVPGPGANDPARHATKSLNRLVTVLSLGVCARLDGFGIHLSLTESRPIVERWVRLTATNQGKEAEEFAILINDVDPLVDDICDALLGELAEERPGTDPWGHEALIPVPVGILTMIVHALTLCVDLASSNSSPAWARNANTNMSRISTLLTDQIISNTFTTDRMHVLMRGKMLPVYGPVVTAPQPALAHLARFFEGTALRVEQGSWHIDGQEGAASDAEIASLNKNLTAHAVLLRDLTSRFGRRTEPAPGS